MSNAKELAPFQRDAIDRIRTEHRAGRRTLLCLPTGTGKTRVAVNYAVDDFVAREMPVLWIAHTQELLEQAYETFRSVGVVSHQRHRDDGLLVGAQTSASWMEVARTWQAEKSGSLGLRVGEAEPGVGG